MLGIFDIWTRPYQYCDDDIEQYSEFKSRNERNLLEDSIPEVKINGEIVHTTLE